MNSNGNGDFLKYFINILIKNEDELISYEVASEEVDRFKDMLADAHKKDIKRFVCFDTVTNMSIAVSIRDIQLVHFLWEKASTNKLECEDFYMENAVNFYFRNQPRPYSSHFDEYGDAAFLYTLLDSLEFDEFGFYSFVDIDGEQVSLRLDELTLVEFNSKILNEGFDEIHNDMEE